MLQSRIMPCLLVHNRGLVKTVKFKDPRYVGDPINTVKIFNEKEVDELIVLDIDATAVGQEPDYGMIEKLAAECRMPFCYGGGIRNLEQAQRIFSLGVEKIALSSAAIARSEFITELAELFGRQSVVAVLDVKKKRFGRRYELCTHNARKSTGIDPVAFAVEMEKRGAGEIVVNSVDRDGVMEGYDMDLIERVRDAVNLPMTVLGGAGSLEDIREVIERHQIIGVAAGSLFVFVGRLRAVLINYPTPEKKHELLAI